MLNLIFIILAKDQTREKDQTDQTVFWRSTTGDHKSTSAGFERYTTDGPLQNPDEAPGGLLSETVSEQPCSCRGLDDLLFANRARCRNVRTVGTLPKVGKIPTLLTMRILLTLSK